MPGMTDEDHLQDDDDDDEEMEQDPDAEEEVEGELVSPKTPGGRRALSGDAKAMHAEASKNRITRQLWDIMLAAYRERPQVRHVMKIANVGRKMATRAINIGWLEFDLPPFVQVCANRTTVYAEMEKVRAAWEASGAPTREASRQAAEEAMAARISMQSAMTMMKANQTVAAKLMERLEAGGADLPDKVTPKLLFQLTKSMDAATQIVQRAMEIERKRLGEPDQILGIQIGTMIEALTEPELRQIYETGEIPYRILSQHPARILEASVEKLPDGPPVDPGALFAVTGDGEEVDLPDPPDEEDQEQETDGSRVSG